MLTTSTGSYRKRKISHPLQIPLNLQTIPPSHGHQSASDYPNSLTIHSTVHTAYYTSILLPPHTVPTQNTSSRKRIHATDSTPPQPNAPSPRPNTHTSHANLPPSHNTTTHQTQRPDRLPPPSPPQNHAPRADQNGPCATHTQRVCVWLTHALKYRGPCASAH